MAIAGSEAVFPGCRIGQLLFDVVLGLRTVGQARVVGNGGRPVDQLIHTAEVVERVGVAPLYTFPYRVHSLLETRGGIEAGPPPHGLHYSTVLCEQFHLGLERLPGHIVREYRRKMPGSQPNDMSFDHVVRRVKAAAVGVEVCGG